MLLELAKDLAELEEQLVSAPPELDDEVDCVCDGGVLTPTTAKFKLLVPDPDWLKPNELVPGPRRFTVWEKFGPVVELWPTLLVPDPYAALELDEQLPELPLTPV